MVNRQDAGMRSQREPGRRARLSVGSRVSTRRSLDSGLPVDRWPPTTGVIVEDYSETVDAAGQEYGRDWALTRRWAVALDDGSLVFRDDEDLDLES